MTLFHIGEISVRPLKEEDAALLVKWLSDPQVLAYYEGRDRPHDLALVQERFYVEADEEHRCIIEYQDEPIGYIQYYPIGEEREEYGYEDLTSRIYGMDQFIGEIDCWNKGIGTSLIQAMVDYLHTVEQADVIIMDPQVWNERALRVYEKCGFVKKTLLKQHEWHEGEMRDCWLIEHRKEAK
ncbi:GNAT family N-acetyltransferase [Paenibacillus sp. 1001270B_150601_E10]|uniref:GNAT family N-acetyltransferase n=1 Tax=Paenibacillus sp. 1001270B_150601_E10 TaxID=2787079 RepID=UPI00189E4042|nr:GNAT family N-acetyltransferase [Paenibacillus sp. 1001270B_150601_E10]